ncbi:MAG: hypothetical protein ACKPEN_17725 [Planktothrix sp.]|jgi:hypothetical protein|uniref:hypothetical protein n=1 Tax=Planktothrix sp. TaxID=3088171 RepID=UPI0038D4B65F
MEHSYPEITLLLIEQAKATFCPDPCLLDPDWVTTALFYYQTHPQENPLSETKQDCVWGAEQIKPRSQWNILSEQAQQASERMRQKWLEGRKTRNEGLD